MTEQKTLELQAVAAAHLASPDPHIAGVSQLLYGNPGPAVALLKRATERNAADTWSDLAAALLVSAEATGSWLAVMDALAAADEALRRQVRHAPAAFNRALALERLGLLDEALLAWREYRTIDAASGWSAEAAASASRLENELKDAAQWPQARAELENAVRRSDEPTIRRIVGRHAHDARAWAESAYPSQWAQAVRDGREETARSLLSIARAIGRALLATSGERLAADSIQVIDTSSDEQRAVLVAAYLTYRQGRIDHAANAADAAKELRAAAKGFARAGSPMQWVAQYYLGAAIYAEQHLDESLAILNSLAARRFSEQGYLALEAQIGWERGLATLSRGSTSAALAIFDFSATLFDRLGEPNNAAMMHDFKALAFDIAGDVEAAWRIRVGALQQFAAAGDAQRKTVALRSAATGMISRQDWRRARPLLNLAIATSTRANDVPRMCGSLALRSAVLAALHEDAAARRDLAELTAMIDRISDARVRAGLLVDAHFAKAVMVRETDPGAAIDHLTKAIDYLASAGHAMFLSRLYLERGRAHHRRGHSPAARSDILAGLEWTERNRQAIVDPQLRAMALRSAEELFQDGIALALEDGKPDEAIALAERARARSLLESFQRQIEPVTALPLPITDIQQSLASTAAVVEYASLRDRLAAFVINAREVRVVETPIARDRLQTIVDASVAAARGKGDIGALELAWNLFIDPIEPLLVGIDRVAISPDRTTATVPFAVLRDPRRHRFLIDDRLVSMVPSASLAVLCSKRASRADRTSVLSISATDFDHRQFPDAQPLQLAASEARAVRNEYASGTLLAASGATARAIAAALPGASVVHFAGHSISPPLDRAASALLVSPVDSVSMLTAREIGRLQMPKTRMVMLSSCGSAAAGDTGDGIESIATAFLVAGVPSVIGAMWDVDDDTAASLALDVHRHFKVHGDAARAFRESVLQRSRSTDAVPPWAVVTPFGGFPGLVMEGER